jgi:myo-inositol 2-dehydrogenase/D-chiro-inositol 1-dehydrogenase
VGEVEEVSAWGSNIVDKRFEDGGDVDTAVTMLRFRNGALGVVEMSRHSAWGYDIRTEVAGALGKVVVEAPQKTPVTWSRRFGYEADHYENFPDRFEVAYRLEFEAFFRTLVEGGTPAPGPEDALETLRLALAAKRSWLERRTVRVDEITAEVPA